MEILLAIVVIGFSVLALTVGVIVKRPSIFGRCGHGKIIIDGEGTTCPSCSEESAKCNANNAD